VTYSWTIETNPLYASEEIADFYQVLSLPSVAALVEAIPICKLLAVGLIWPEGEDTAASKATKPTRPTTMTTTIIWNPRIAPPSFGHLLRKRSVNRAVWGSPEADLMHPPSHLPPRRPPGGEAILLLPPRSPGIQIKTIMSIIHLLFLPVRPWQLIPTMLWSPTVTF
jgi:hypothetical protein